MKDINYKKIEKMSQKKGAIFMFVVFILTLTTVAIAVGFSSPNIREFKNAIRDNISNTAFLLAEAGNEDVYYRLKQGMNVPASITYTLGDVTAVTTVTTIGSSREIKTVSTLDNHVRTAELKVSSLTTNIEFLYSAQIGEGGVSMGNNAEIIGDFYSAGPVIGSSGATITGNVYVSSSLIADNLASSTICDTDRIIAQADPQNDFAQSFQPSTTTTLHSININIKKVGNPNSIKMKIVADNSGEPDTTTLTEGTLDKTKVISTYSWVSIPFDSQISLTASTTYWMVLDAKKSSSKYWIWCADSSASYIDGSAMYSKKWTSDPWTAISEDLTFKTMLGEGGESSISDVTVTGDVHADTIKDNVITGDAYYKTIINPSVTGTEYPNSNTPTDLQVPVSDAIIAQWKVDAENGGVINGNCGDDGAEPSCAVGDDDELSLGPIKVNGDLIITGNNQTINITGTVYITGIIDFDGNGLTVQCDPSFGVDSCILMTDESIHLRNNIDFTGSGDPNSYIMLMTFITGCNGSGGTGCTHHDSGIDYHNNGSGAIVYAPYSQVYLHNGVELTGVVANRLELSENAKVIYEDEINDPTFASGGGTSWLVNDWREIE